MNIRAFSAPRWRRSFPRCWSITLGVPCNKDVPVPSSAIDDAIFIEVARLSQPDWGFPWYSLRATMGLGASIS